MKNEGQYFKKIEKFHDPIKNWGVRTTDHIKKNSIVVEYQGEYIESYDKSLAQERLYSKEDGCYMFFFFVRMKAMHGK